MKTHLAVTGAMGLVLAITALIVWWRSNIDIKQASDCVARAHRRDDQGQYQRC